MNKEDTIKEIFEATRNVIPGKYDAMDLFYRWHIDKQIYLLKKVYKNVMNGVELKIYIRNEINRLGNGVK